MLYVPNTSLIPRVALKILKPHRWSYSYMLLCKLKSWYPTKKLTSTDDLQTWKKQLNHSQMHYQIK